MHVHGRQQFVRCLRCTWLYTKPAGGGTYERNPGCPKCGYLGWSPAPLTVVPVAAPLHEASSAPK
jgi:NAD-dependent SIR2 family protein deacetylase